MLVLSWAIRRSVQRSSTSCITASRRQQRHARFFNFMLGNGCMEPGDGCSDGDARSVGTQDDFHPPHNRRIAGSCDRGRRCGTVCLVFPLGWDGRGFVRCGNRYLRWLRHLVPILSGFPKSEDNVWPKFVNFTIVLQELDFRLQEPPIPEVFIPQMDQRFLKVDVCGSVIRKAVREVEVATIPVSREWTKVPNTPPDAARRTDRRSLSIPSTLEKFYRCHGVRTI